MKKTKAAPKVKKTVKNTKKQPVWALPVLFGLAGLFVGIIAGYYIPKDTSVDPRYVLASKSELRAAETAITNKFINESSIGCTDPTDPVSPDDRVEVFKKYLKVNKYANRAVIRGCNDIDSLLAKNPITGEWGATTVNVSLDTRANTAWQHECLIDDITKTDTVSRPENESIDVYNFVDCRKLLEREQVYSILTANRGLQLNDITQKDVDSYIEGAEKF